MIRYIAILAALAFISLGIVSAKSDLQVADDLKDEIKLLLNDYGKYSDVYKSLLEKSEMETKEMKETLNTLDQKTKELKGSFTRCLDNKDMKQHATLSKLLSHLQTLSDMHKGEKRSNRIGKSYVAKYTTRVANMHLKATEELIKGIKDYIKSPKDFSFNCDLCSNKILIECQACNGGGACKAVYSPKPNNTKDFCQKGEFSSFDLKCAVCNASGTCGFCYGTGKTCCPLFIVLNDLHKK